MLSQPAEHPSPPSVTSMVKSVASGDRSASLVHRRFKTTCMTFLPQDRIKLRSTNPIEHLFDAAAI
jgi:hypothetical protein